MIDEYKDVHVSSSQDEDFIISKDEFDQDIDYHDLYMDLEIEYE